MPQEAVLYERVLTDLSGGLNDRAAPLIQDNQCTSNSKDCFFNLLGGVETRYGNNVFNSVPGTGQSPLDFVMAFVTGAEDTLIAARQGLLYYIGAGTPGGSWTNMYYTNGTATFTNGSSTVTLATGTSEWTTQLGASDKISADGSTFYTVSSVTNDTTLVLTANFAEGTTTAAYSARQITISGRPAKGVMYNGSLYFQTGGVSNSIMYTSNGTSTRRQAATAALVLLINFKNYLFGVRQDNVTNSSRLYWSALLDAASWPASTFVDVSPSDGEPIRALVVHNDLLFIFKETSIWYLAGDVFDPSNPTYVLRKLANPQLIGTTHGESVKVFGDKIMFLGPDGIYALTGLGSIVNITANSLRTTIRTYATLASQLGTLNATEAAGVVHDDRYWLSVSTSQTARNTKTIVVESNGAMGTHAFGVNNFVIARGTSGLPKGRILIGMAYSSGTTFQPLYFDGTSVDDYVSGAQSAINSIFETKVFNFGDPARTTHVMDVFVSYDNLTKPTGSTLSANLLVYDDAGQVGSTAAFTFPAGSTQDIAVQKFAVDRDTNGLKIRVTNTATSGYFRILSIAVTYKKQMMGSAKVITS